MSYKERLDAAIEVTRQAVEDADTVRDFTEELGYSEHEQRKARAETLFESMHRHVSKEHPDLT